MRKSGVLLSITSLPGKYGIGSLSKEAYDFVDFLVTAGQHYWQILPLGPTGYGDSPYQAYSTYAGNPYLIDLEDLIQQKLLTRKEVNAADLKDNDEYVNYDKMYAGKLPLLKKAFGRFDLSNSDFKAFCKSEKAWLEDYALFMAIKDDNKGAGLSSWEDAIKLRKPAALKEAKKRLEKEVLYYSFLQYQFFTQWKKFKDYANEKGIEIIGDIPIYVSPDSSDVWSNPKMFQLDKNFCPTAVAGCPPDYFSKDGQLWGNPLYDWEYHKQTGYDWWVNRVEQCFRLYDVVRIDHFRGFDSYYSIPYGAENAVNGHWEKGPGYDLFKTIKTRLGNRPIIAEDLGFLTPSVYKLVAKCGYPGMKILEFGLGNNPECEYLPYNFTTNNCVVYTGTHDNETIVGWYESLKPKRKKITKEYLNIKSAKNIHWDMIRLAYASIADTAIIPVQDLLGLGNESRMNTPSTLGINWKWRMKEEALTPELASKMYELSRIYGRI